MFVIVGSGDPRYRRLTPDAPSQDTPRDSRQTRHTRHSPVPLAPSGQIFDFLMYSQHMPPSRKRSRFITRLATWEMNGPPPGSSLQPYYRFTDEWFSWVVVQWVGVDCFGMRDAIRLHVQVLVLRRLMKELVEDFTRISYFNTWPESKGQRFTNRKTVFVFGF
jgi:hypothetical protein